MNIQSFLIYLRNLNITLGLDQEGLLDIEAPQGVLTAALVQQIREQKAALTAYLQQVKMEQEAENLITAAPAAADYPLSSAQMRLWLTGQLDEDSTAYNISSVQDMPGDLEPTAFEAAINAVVERHEILRTVFREDTAGMVRQHILPVSKTLFRLNYIDLSGDVNAKERAYQLMESDSNQPFDLSAGPLFRVILFRTSPSHHLLYFNMHHIISDGWSLNILAADIMHYYRRYTGENIPALSSLEIQYKDYAVWQQARLQTPIAAGHRNYWMSQFAGELPVLELPVAGTRPAKLTHNGYAFTCKLDKTLLAQLKEVCRQEEATLFMGLITSLKVLLYRYTGQEDIVTGTSVAGREQPALQQQIGFYINTLPLRVRFSGTDNFRQLLRKVKQVVLDGFQHQDYPFDKLVEDLQVKRDLSRSPLFDTMVILHNEKDLQTTTTEDLVLHGRQPVKFDLNIDFNETADGMLMKIGFNTDIYETDSMLRLAAHYKNLLQSLITLPATAIKEIHYLDATEQEKLLHTFNQTAAAYPADVALATLFTEQAKRTPDHIALQEGDRTLTFEALETESNRLASYLRKKGVGPETFAAVCMAPSVKLITGILAILKTGAAYVPVDPDNTPARIAHILEETKPVVILTDGKASLPVPQDIPLVDIYEDAGQIAEEAAAAVQQPPLDADKLCCVIYTSGSTGKPKGVTIREKAVLNRLYWMWKEYPFVEDECHALKTSVGFVDHIWELFGPLSQGVRSVIFTKEEILDTEGFIRQLSDRQVTRLVLVPSLLKALLQKLEAMDTSMLDQLCYWSCSGEYLSADLVYDFYSLLPQHTLLNIYGSSEVMGDVTCYNTVPVFGAQKAPDTGMLNFDFSIRNDVDDLIEEFNSRDEIIKTVTTREAVKNFYDVSIDKVWKPEEYVEFLRKDLLPNIVNVSSPNYLGHMTSKIPAFIKDLSALLIELNQNLVKIDTSFAGSSIERQVIGIMHKVVYRMRYTFYKKHVQDAQYCLGVVTNGGTLSNITALSYALNKALPVNEHFRGIVEEGIVKALAHYRYKGVVVLSSRLAHYSINKAMRTLGLGTAQCFKFDIDREDLESGRRNLIASIEKFRSEGMLILAIVGVAGATETGRIDPLDTLADIAEEYGIHFHADAAFGGMILFSPVLAKKLKGINRADSVTICGHKQMYLPMGASVCLFRSPDFASFSENNTFYQARKGSYDLGRFSIEGSRSFVSLLFHGALKLLGAKGFSELMELNYQKTLLLAEKISLRDNFEITTAPEMNILTYRYIPAALLRKSQEKMLTQDELLYINDLNRKLQKLEFTKGRYFVSFTEIEFLNPALGVDRERVVVLRAVIMNPNTTGADFDAMLDEQAVIAAQLEEGGQFTLPGLLLSETVNRYVDKKNRIVPIGKPIANSRVYVLDRNNCLMPVGVPGEICIAGDGLSAGYLHQPELTREKFVPDPFRQDGILYRSGDTGVWLPDGNIEYRGRTDDQVKIRGNRIEPGEIEHALQQLQGIDESVVLAQKGADGELQLIAYIIGREKQQASALRQQLAFYLPDYMIPAVFVQLDKWPLTASGKINRKELAVSAAHDILSSAAYVPPVNEIERKMCAIWQQLLERETAPGTADDFFSIGGHSLRMMQLANQYKNTFGVKLSVKELFRHTTVSSQAALMAGRTAISHQQIPRLPEMTDYPVSDGQRRIWVLSQQPEAAKAYVLSGMLELENADSIARMKQAVAAVVARHEILRTIFTENTDGALRQIVLPVTDSLPQFAELTAAGEQDVATVIAAQGRLPFALDKGPLLRTGFVTTADGRHFFFYHMHHIISDGWSVEILRREITAVFQQNGDAVQLPPLPIQYRDYAAWQQQLLQSGELGNERAYWLQQLSGDLPIIEMPSRQQRPSVKTYNGHVFSVRIGEDVTTDFTSLCKTQECTLFMGLLGVLNTLLFRYTGHTDIITGTSVAGRHQPELEHQLGFYINALPLRTRLSATDTFTTLLQRIREVTLEAFDHQRYPFDKLVEELGVKGDLSRSPLFDMMLILHNERDQQEKTGLQNGVIVDGGPVNAKFDYLFYFTEREGGLDMSIEFNTDIYDHDSVVRMITHFSNLLQSLAAKPETRLDQVDYLGAAEKDMLRQFGANVKPYTPQTIMDIFSVVCQEKASQTAVSDGEATLTYHELAALSGRLAYCLQQRYGIKAHDLVGIQLERSLWTAPLIWAILQCGAAYVPLDTAYPAARTAMIAENSQCRLLITETIWEEIKAVATVPDAPVAAPVALSPAHTAYVIYTSGSTGTPKGVVISHGNLYHYMQHCLHTYFNDAAVTWHVPLFTSLSFDLTVTSLFGATLSGGKLVVYRQSRPVNEVLEDIFFGGDINFLKCTPAHVLLLEGVPVRPSAVRQAILGGEELSPYHITLLQQVRGDMVIHNEYGPTETTVGCTVATISGPYLQERVSIGRPIANTWAYVLDSSGNMLPPGVAGELCIGGDGVGKGYLHQEELTAARFVADPYRPGEVIYRTGDNARWQADGTLDYLGRADTQLKVRGYRIEPGEIELALQQLPGIKAAVVAVTGTGKDKALTAWITADTQPDIPRLRQQLAAQLPAYMVPDHMVRLESFPLTPNGKTDRAALLSMKAGLPAGHQQYIAPRNHTEEKVMRIWQDILKITVDISVEEDFLQLGGNSLRLMQLFNRYYRAFGVKVTLQKLFAAGTIAGHAALISSLPAGVYEEMSVLPAAADYPVSDGERRIWVLCQMEHAARSYHLGGVMQLEGTYHAAYFEEAVKMVTARHEVLRTVFRENAAGELRRIILPPELITGTFTFHDVTGWEQPAIDQLLTAAAAGPFDLASGPLFRIGLLQLGADNYLLYYTLHHIISDGWSVELLSREISLCYDALSSGQQPDLPALRIQYKDYVAWQQQQLQTDKMQAHRAYWLQQLSGELPVLQLPAFKPRPVVLTYNGNALSVLISKDRMDKLRQVCRTRQATLFMGLVAVLKTLLYRYTGQEDIILGVPVAGRDHAELENQIGFYVNTLALRTRFSGNDSFEKMIGEVRRQVAAAFEHQSYPFDKLVEELGVKRDLSRAVLFDVMIMLQNFKVAQASGKLPGHTAETITDEGPCGIKFDLNFGFTESTDGLILRVEYSTAVYDKPYVIQLMQHFDNLLDALTTQPGMALNKAVYLSADEQRQLLTGFNDTAADYPEDETVPALFRDKVVACYDAPAVTEGTRIFTYGELDERSNQLAHYLLQKGVKAGTLVPVCMERSADLVTAILAIVKTGAAYVPVDPAYPAHRIAWMLSDTRANVVVTNDKYLAYFDGYTEITIVSTGRDEALIQHEATGRPDIRLQPDNLIYTIYTSGSTGNPKGVMIRHTSLINLVHWHIGRYDVQKGAQSTMMAGPGFDAGALELWSALLSGSTLHIIPDEVKLDSHALMHYYVTHGITHAFVPPALVTELVRVPQPELPALKYILIGGDKLPHIDVSALSYTLVNQYGPTEATVMVTDYAVSSNDTVAPPVGRPIANSCIYILDEWQQLVPAGVSGEIYIGGVQLATGYWNNEALTQEKFIVPPFKFSSGERWYKTGDKGRWLPDGNIEYMGRTDEQVKIRGYRIEPGEITHVLLQEPSISNALVTTFSGADGQPQLVAYYESEHPVPAETLRGKLAAQLPEYMMPAVLEHLVRLPLTPNGKVDRQALPVPVLQATTTAAKIPPRNEVEKSMQAIVAEVLGRDPQDIGIEDNFFDLGASSLTMVKLVNSINRSFGQQLNVITLFRYPKISALADAFYNTANGNAAAPEYAAGETAVEDMLTLFEES